MSANFVKKEGELPFASAAVVQAQK